MKILIIDDDDDDVLLFKDCVYEIDSTINIISTDNGRDCISIIERNEPNIIFLDINMPIMGGKECLQQIKNHPKYHDIPVVMYCTRSFPHEVEYYTKQGVKHLEKPTNHNDFLIELKSILMQYDE